MIKILINIIKGIIKLPFFTLYLLFIPLMFLAELEELGNGKTWNFDGFFYKIMDKINEFITKIANL